MLCMDAALGRLCLLDNCSVHSIQRVEKLVDRKFKTASRKHLIGMSRYSLIQLELHSWLAKLYGLPLWPLMNV
jgi:hypothetical protein